MTRNNSFTIDPYSDYQAYNNALQALKNNGVKYEESILTKAPFEFFIHLEDDTKPLLINYDLMSTTQWKQAVSKTLPLVPNDEFLLYRRTEKAGSIFQDLISNDVFNTSLKASRNIVFNENNKDKIREMSKNIQGKIYPLGKYIGKFRLWICFDGTIKSLVSPGNILLDTGKITKPGDLEKKINFDILRNRDKLIKYIRTPYFENGKFFNTSPQSPIWKQMS